MQSALERFFISRRQNIPVLLVLAIILATAAEIRFYRLGANSLWYDEACSYISATGWQLRVYTLIPTNTIIANPPEIADSAHAKPWWQVLRPDTDDAHPPLYFFLLRLWASVIGWHPADLRAMSVVFSLTAIALLYGVVAALNGVVSGLFAAAIMAFAQPQIELAREARPYTMELALALAAALAVVKVQQHGLSGNRVFGLAIACFAMLLTQYLSCVVIVTLAIYSLMCLRGAARRRIVFVCAATALLFLILWSPVIYAQNHGHSREWSNRFHDGSADHLKQTLYRLVNLPGRFLFEALPESQRLLEIVPIILLLGLLRLRQRPDLILWILWLPINIFPPLAGDLYAHSISLYIRRYSFSATPALYALLSSLTSDMRPALRYLLPGIALIGCVLHFPQGYEPAERTITDWARYAQDFNQLAKPGDLTILLRQPLGQEDYVDFICLSPYLSHWPGPVLLVDRPPSPRLINEINSYTHAIVIGANCNEMLLPYLPQSTVLNLRQRVFLGQIRRIQLHGLPASLPIR